MSVTFMRYKDGKPAPIKLSVWDAFKGVPNPKPRPHRCNLCNKIHKPDGKKDKACETEPSDQKEQKPAEAAEKPKAGEIINHHGFTAEEDAKIRAMKGEDATWAAIAEALGNGRKKDHVKSRFKDLQTMDAEPKAEDKGKEEKEGEGEPKKLTKAEKKAKAREEALKKQDEGEAKKDEKDESKAQAVETNETKAAEPTVPEPEKPIKEATRAKVAMDDKQRWIAAASKHFDRTGERVTLERARQLAENTT